MVNESGATPTYGSPSGLGAADTGFDSLNVPRAKTQKVRAAACAPHHRAAAAGDDIHVIWGPVAPKPAWRLSPRDLSPHDVSP
jgi:hypothetical protein